MGLDGANAREESSCPFTETTRLASGICFPLWSGLSEPSQTHGALRSLTGSGLELLRGSDPLPGARRPGGSSGAVGRWPATPRVIRGWLPSKKGGEGGSPPWTGDPWVARGGQGSTRQSECPMRPRLGSRTPNCFSLLFPVLQRGVGRALTSGEATLPAASPGHSGRDGHQGHQAGP